MGFGLFRGRIDYHNWSLGLLEHLYKLHNIELDRWKGKWSEVEINIRLSTKEVIIMNEGFCDQMQLFYIILGLSKWSQMVILASFHLYLCLHLE